MNLLYTATKVPSPGTCAYYPANAKSLVYRVISVKNPDPTWIAIDVPVEPCFELKTQYFEGFIEGESIFELGYLTDPKPLCCHAEALAESIGKSFKKALEQNFGN